jgi:hypothetical protein
MEAVELGNGQAKRCITCLHFGEAGMVFLHVRTREPFSTTGTDSFDLSQMCLIHMASAAPLLDQFRASGPGALYFVSSALLNRMRELLVKS